MIDTRTETVIRLSQASEHFPGRPSIATLYRWITRGARGARLESVVCGAQRYTSIEAIDRFFAATTANSVGGSAPAQRRTTRRREADIRRAEERLARAGA